MKCMFSANIHHLKNSKVNLKIKLKLKKNSQDRLKQITHPPPRKKKKKKTSSA